jgi:hypothetical protein
MKELQTNYNQQNLEDTEGTTGGGGYMLSEL